MYLVCQFKEENGKLFITTRMSRETMISVLQDLGQEIDSMVLETFATYAEAEKYKKGIEEVNKTINNL